MPTECVTVFFPVPNAEFFFSLSFLFILPMSLAFFPHCFGQVQHQPQNQNQNIITAHENLSWFSFLGTASCDLFSVEGLGFVDTFAVPSEARVRLKLQPYPCS